MNFTLIYQHLGLGDHLICNGLIREICYNHETTKFLLPATKINFESVKFMFKDINNLTIICVNGDECVHKMIYENKYKTLLIGHNFLNPYKNFDKSFYDQLGVNFDKRWSSFFIERDYDREVKFYEMNQIKNDFIFVHDDPGRSMQIDFKYLNGKNIIKADVTKTNIIFDYLTILENAKEIHCIESSFLFLIDSFNFKGRLFNHRYARQYPKNNTPTLRNKWNILSKKDNEIKL